MTGTPTNRPHSDFPAGEIPPGDIAPQLLATLDRDAAPVDRARLDQLKRTSLESFTRESRAKSPSLRERTSMAAIRLLLTIAASLLVALGIWSSQSSSAPMTLDDAVAALQSAPAYQGQLTIGEQSFDVTGQGSSSLRVDLSADQYYLQQNQNTWNILPRENIARTLDSSIINLDPQAPRSTSDAAFFSLCSVTSGEIHPLSLLGLEPSTAVIEPALADSTEPLLIGTAQSIVDGQIGNWQLRYDPRTRQPLEFSRTDAAERRTFTVQLLDAPADGAKLEVADTLSADGRIGEVVDITGLAFVQARDASRSTPLTPNTLLFPGDLVRVDARSRSAVRIALAGGSWLIAGPGAQLVLDSPTQLHLDSGDLRTASGKRNLTLFGPDQKSIAVSGTELFRATGDKLETLDRMPDWLTAFLGQSSDQSLGALIAKIDGREVKLDVGMHHVTVDIRNQIARTTIVESFVNRTDNVLEGTFHFPLPADASISGFGMWIGDELVEADIVEKQRAREIFETILREKRDPGLLEWSAGNQFKARVYPIPAHGEKRIKIVYTQVLPMHGSQLRYRYHLASELLQTSPLTDLKIQANIVSTLPMKKVSSATHPVRVSQTANTARAEFSAANYRPERDFELTIEHAPPTSAITLVPHVRGDDGYFLMMFQPPGDQANWRRTEVASGDPLRLTLVVDTSASMNQVARRNQQQTLAAILQSLGERDLVQLIAIDVSSHRASDEPLLATAENVTKLLKFAQSRRSLGWSNLQAGLLDAITRTSADSHLIYLGDGMHTAAPRVESGTLAGEIVRQARAKQITIHTIAMTSVVDSTVMQTIARGTSGGYRQLTSESTPAIVASQLLQEITHPAVRDLTLEIHGLRTARVYPAELPNLPAGEQLLVLGRYLPTGEKLEGEVTVRGTSQGKPVEFRQAVSIDVPRSDATADDVSFLPRLWAKQHLDQLLLEAQTPEVRQQIIGLSEEYHLMTPYTSLLVLETDADRERFKVKRTLQMSDGERFFADAQTKVRDQLRYQQMLAARGYRANLIAQAHASLTQGLGGENRYQSARSRLAGDQTTPSLFGPISGSITSTTWDAPLEFSKIGEQEQLLALGVTAFGFSSFGGGGMGGMGGGAFGAAGFDGGPFGGEGSIERFYSVDDGLVRTQRTGLSILPVTDFVLPMTSDGKTRIQLPEFAFGDISRGGLNFSLPAGSTGIAGRPSSRRLKSTELFAESTESPLPRNSARAVADPARMLPISLPSASPARAPWKGATPGWTADARALAEELAAAADFKKLGTAVAIRSESKSLDSDTAKLSIESKSWQLLAVDRWLVRDEGSTFATNYCTLTKRGTLSPLYDLHLQRAAEPDDLQQSAMEMGLSLQANLLSSYRDYRASIAPSDVDEHVWLELRNAEGYFEEDLRLLVHRQRKTIVEVWQNSQKWHLHRRYKNFLQIGELWLPQNLENFDHRGRSTMQLSRTIEPRTADQFDADFTSAMRPLESYLTLESPFPAVSLATPPVGEISPSHRLAWIAELADRYQLPQALDQLAILSKTPHADWLCQWISIELMRHQRDKQPLAKVLHSLANDLLKSRRDGRVELARDLISEALTRLDSVDFRAIHQQLRPLFHRAGASEDDRYFWDQVRANEAASRNSEDTDTGPIGESERLILARQLANDYPDHREAVLRYASELSDAEEHETEIAVLLAAIERMKKLGRTDEVNRFYEIATSIAIDAGNIDQERILLDAWRRDLGEVTSESWWWSNFQTLLFLNREKEVLQEVRSILAQAAAHEQLTSDQTHQLHHAVDLLTGDFSTFEAFHQPDQEGNYPFQDELLKVLVVQASQPNSAEICDDIVSWFSSVRPHAMHPAVHSILTNLAERTETRSIAEITSLAEVLRYASIAETDHTLLSEIGDKLIERLLREKIPSAQQSLGDAIVSLVPQRDEVEYERLRQLISKTDGQVRDYFHAKLLDKYRYNHFPEKADAELLAMVLETSRAKPKLEQLIDQLEQLSPTIDEILEHRAGEQVRKIMGDPKLKRDERSKAIEQAVLQVHEQLIAELRKLQDDRPLWNLALQLEIHQLRLSSVPTLQAIRADAWKQLDLLQKFTGQTLADESLSSSDKQATLALTASFHEQLIALLGNLATQGKIDDKEVDKLLAIVQAKHSPGTIDDDQRHYWQHVLLLAADRPQELKKQLAAWLAEDVSNHTLRWSLAQLHAELGELDQAIQVLQPLTTANSLDSEQLLALSDWQLANGDLAGSKQTRYDSYCLLSDYTHYQHFQNLAKRSDTLSETLDERDIDRLRAFLSQTKSDYPQGSAIAPLYKQRRDFRLLAQFAEVLVDQSPDRAREVLLGIQPLLSEVYEEAALSELTRYCQTLLDKKQKPHVAQSLHLLAMLSEARATQVPGAAELHAKQALQHLAHVIPEVGERREEDAAQQPLSLLQLLAAMPPAEDQQLANQLLAKAEQLAMASPAGSTVRLRMIEHLASMLEKYNQVERAEMLLLQEIDAAVVSTGDRPHPAILPLVEQLTWLVQERGSFRQADQLLRSLLAKSDNQRFSREIRLQIATNETAALHADGETTQGRGEPLLRSALATAVESSITTKHRKERSEWVAIVISLLEAGHSLEIESVPQLAIDAARKLMPIAAELGGNTSNETAVNLATTLLDVAGPSASIEFTLALLDIQPLSRKWSNQPLWDDVAPTLAVSIDELENPQAARRQLPEEIALLDTLLKRVCDILREQLESGRDYRDELFDDDRQYFWEQKKDAFGQVAMEVAKAAKHEDVILRAASYLNDNLSDRDNAIKLLTTAMEQQLLSPDGKYQLARWLEDASQFKRSLDVLRPLVDAPGDWLDAELMLVEMLERTGAKDEAKATYLQLKKKYFAVETPNAVTVSQLAGLCHQLTWSAEVHELVPPLIASLLNANSGDDRDNGELSRLYWLDANALSGLGDTIGAVEAVSSMIVLTPRDQEAQKEAIGHLVEILGAAKDLPGYVKHLDKLAAETAQDRPILRKAIGEVFASREAWENAIAQYRLANELMPEDSSLASQLIDALIQVGKVDEANEQLLRSLEIDRRQNDWWKLLAKNFESQGDRTEAQRAIGSIIDTQPGEANAYREVAKWKGADLPKLWLVVHLRDAVALDPKNRDLAVELLSELVSSNEQDEARELIAELRKLELPEDEKKSFLSLIEGFERQLNEQEEAERKKQEKKE